MKVFVTGTRGVPGIPGGVETHCEQLYPRIASQVSKVMVSRRSSYVTEIQREWSGLALVDIYSPAKKSLEAIVHTTLCVFKARKWGADIVHIHGVGPALLVPLARFLGMKVVFTNHGPDYERAKWGRLARWVLRLGEYLGGKFANEVIAISEPIRKIMHVRCNRKSHLIYNGSLEQQLTDATNYLYTLNIKAGSYVLAVARLVPEKGLHDLVTAFTSIDDDIKLVIAGEADHKDTYSETLKKMAAENDRIVMPGYVTGENLSQLFSHAGLFVLPSYHEGLPIALLEALSFGLPVIASDIPANVEVGLDEFSYFPAGNVKKLKHVISRRMNQPWSRLDKDRVRAWVAKKYNWDDIAEQTMAVYKKTFEAE